MPYVVLYLGKKNSGNKVWDKNAVMSVLLLITALTTVKKLHSLLLYGTLCDFFLYLLR